MSREARVPGIAGALPDDAKSVGWLPPPEIFELSATRNIIHIVLDAFPSRTFTQILEADRSAFDRDWSGFTFFANHLGAHRTTLGSMPAMLSGVAFRNEMPFREFVASHPSVFHVLGQQGYRLRSLASRGHDHLNPSFPGVDAAIRYDIPTPYGSYRDYVDVAAAQLLDLSLFRHVPHTFKPSIYRDQQWLLQQRIASRLGPVAEPLGDAMFLREFASRVTVGDDAPVYTFLHVLTPHIPIVTDADCAYARKPGPSAEDFTNQARCALSAVRMLLDRLRDLDLYDRTDVIVTSDHGLYLVLVAPEDQHPLRGIRSPAGRTLAQIETFATPLLLVKPFAVGSARDLLRPHLHHRRARHSARPRRPLQHSWAWHFGTQDRPYSASSSHLRTSQTGHPTDSLYGVLYEFSVNGRTDDPNAWSYHQTVFGPTNDRAEQRREHRIGLRADQDDSANESGDRIYRTDGYAVFYMEPESSRVTFDVRRMSGMTTAQTVTVRIDGDVADQHVLADNAWHTLSYPIEARSEDSPFCIELLTSPVWYDATGESWGPMLRGDI